MAKRSARWTAEQLEDATQHRMSGALRALGLGSKLEGLDAGQAVVTGGAKSSKKSKTTTKKTLAASEGSKVGIQDAGAEDIPAKRKKRQGAQTAPIFKSLELAPAHAMWDKDSFSLEIPGGRILTYNELFSILQFRKYEAFRYKKLCRGVVARAVFSGGTATPKPFFAGPTRLILVREAAKDMDRDALPIVFKYFLDALKHEGIIDDDNPNIIVDIQSHQKVGTPRLGMRLERLTDWTPPDVPTWTEWKKQTVPTIRAERKKKTKA